MCSLIMLTAVILFVCLSLISVGAVELGISLLFFYIIIVFFMFKFRDFSDKMHAKRLGRINYYADKEYEKKVEEENDDLSIK